ncbi:MAG: MBL fold metallo-hydrolase [Rhizomicrobium sp.]|nr:MBL fold metallo-hydrolase [Rhizomicrobium sp.]
MVPSREELVKNAPREAVIDTRLGPVAIFAVHHASFILNFKRKFIFVDPAPPEDEPQFGADFSALPKPDLILYTHSHCDHYNAEVLQAIMGPETRIIAPAEVAAVIPEELRSKVLVMANGGTASLLGVGIEAVPMYNTGADRAKYHPKGMGNGYVLTIGEKRIYIAGDSDETPEVAHLPNIDVAFLPLNISHGTTLEAIVQWVKKFKPAVVYPYHIRNAHGTVAELRAFATDVGSDSLVMLLRWY